MINEAKFPRFIFKSRKRSNWYTENNTFGPGVNLTLSVTSVIVEIFIFQYISYILALELKA